LPELRLTLEEGRQLAVKGAQLAAPQPSSILDVVHHLGALQIDPTNAVARTELLVLWSRLGDYSVAELERLRWEERSLFEYWARIVPVSDFAIHRETMRRYPRGESARARYVRGWLAGNASFRRYVVRELRKRGPLRSRDLEDRAAVPWKTGGWNDGKSLGRLLDVLWFKGEIAIAARDGNERVWAAAEDVLPLSEPRLPPREVARRLLETQLRWCGLARSHRFGFAFDGAPPARDSALRALLREGRAVTVEVEGLPGEWLAHADVLEKEEQEFRPRTTLLSPFDVLVADRDFAAELFEFRYRLEMYVPAAKREYGYYVLPILHGDRLVGRVDSRFDRKASVYRVNEVYAEPCAPSDAGPHIAAALSSLSTWLGAERFEVERAPALWRAALSG
jgi:uncharacterized protein YcaQ